MRRCRLIIAPLAIVPRIVFGEADPPFGYAYKSPRAFSRAIVAPNMR